MNLLQLIGVTDSFQRCAECARLARPAIRAHNNGSHTSAYHCFRCYHILAAVTIAPFDRPSTAARKEGN